MPEPVGNQATDTFTSVAFLLSLAAIYYVVQRYVQGKPLLPYEPRRPVPWGSWATLIAIFCLVQAFSQWLTDPGDAAAAVDPIEFISLGWWNSAIMIGFVICAMSWLFVVCRANAHDLGLPTSLPQLASDIAIGCCACLAAGLPVFVIHGLLNKLFQPNQQHQLIELLLEHSNPLLWLVGALVAVIAAPLFEEFAFRLLLQGWLERWEDELLDTQHISQEPAASPEALQLQQDLNETQEPLFSYADLPVNGQPVPESPTHSEPNTPLAPPRQNLFGLPHGWAPILISGTAFGLAHISQGVSWLPLVLFGIVLGYLYQRTHRLAPCIAAHMLFNAFTITQLWLLLK